MHDFIGALIFNVPENVIRLVYTISCVSLVLGSELENFACAEPTCEKNNQYNTGL